MKIDQDLILKAVRFFSEKVGNVDDAKINFFFSENSDLGFYDHLTGEIYLDKTLTGRTQILALFHELTHFWQAKKGAVKFRLVGVECSGKLYSSKEMRQGYWNLPWEVEARAVSEFWVDRFLHLTK